MAGSIGHLSDLIDVDEVKEMFRISGYLFMTWKDPRLAFSSAAAPWSPAATNNETPCAAAVWNSESTALLSAAPSGRGRTGSGWRRVGRSADGGCGSA
jgi:hypothetical protein